MKKEKQEYGKVKPLTGHQIRSTKLPVTEYTSVNMQKYNHQT
jgi:hypothetical protein